MLSSGLSLIRVIYKFYWISLHTCLRLVYQRYDPNFLAASLDEAYLDITDFCNDKGMTGGQVCQNDWRDTHLFPQITTSYYFFSSF